jgi:hypothetical protein
VQSAQGRAEKPGFSLTYQAAEMPKSAPQKCSLTPWVKTGFLFTWAKEMGFCGAHPQKPYHKEDCIFMKTSGWKPRRLRRGGKPARRRRAQPFVVVGDQRRAACGMGRASGPCYNHQREESSTWCPYGLPTGIPLCVDTSLPAQGTCWRCSATAGGVDPRDLRGARLGGGGVDSGSGPRAPVCRLSAS